MPKRPTGSKYKRIAFVASAMPEAQKARRRLAQRYGDARPETADVIVALGGDGLMLQTLQRFMNSGKPIYGMHRGTVGFLMNEFAEVRLQRTARRRASHRHPSAADARARCRRPRARHHAINEVSLFRQTYQAARLRILVDGKERLPSSSPTASWCRRRPDRRPTISRSRGRSFRSMRRCLALTPISPFRPRRWRGALLPDRARVTIEVLEADKRPVAAVADHDEVRSVRSVEISMDHAIACTCCSIPATASTSAFSASNSATEGGRRMGGGAADPQLSLSQYLRPH